jgi:hypothetical protein
MSQDLFIPTDEELLLRLGNCEDNFVERKRFSDGSVWTRAIVAFANSCPIGFPGVLFIGVYDDGRLEQLKEGVNLDSLQKKLTEKIAEVWPPVYVVTKILRKDGQEFLAVLVPGSPQRPHFSGHSYVRVGCQTRKASEAEFDNLILQRTSKAREILKMIGKNISWEMMGRKAGGSQGKLVDCNQFFVTFDGGTYKICWPIEWITISYDPANDRHHLIVHHP